MINIQKELNSLLEKLRKLDTEKNTDIDLVFNYLEEYLNNLSIGGGSKKLMEFEIQHDPSSMAKIYNVKWRRTDIEEMQMGTGDAITINYKESHGED